MDASHIFVGRNRERASIRSYIAAATLRGQGCLILVGGDAGAGKSALLRQVAEDVEKDGAQAPVVVVGRSLGAGEALPYGPWREVVGRFSRLTSRPADQLPQPFGLDAGAWGPFETTQAVLNWLTASGSVVLIEIEDIHLADHASLEMLQLFATYVGSSPIVILATYRRDEVQRSHPLKEWLADVRQLGAVDLALRGLTLEEIAQLATAEGLDLTEMPLALRRIRERTGGLALFVREIISEVLAEGARTTQHVTSLVDTALPETVQHAIDARLNRLAPNVRRMLEVAAVMDAEVSSALLGKVLELSGLELADTVEQAIDDRVLTPVDSSGDLLCFPHALVREVMLAHVVGPRRKMLHARIAAALQDAPGKDPDAISFHLVHAGDPQAAAYLSLAADRAVRCGAISDARKRYEQALSLVPGADTYEHRGTDPVASRAELLLKVGFTARTEDPKEAEACLREAAALAAQAGDRVVETWARHLLASAAVERRDRGLEQSVLGIAAAQEALSGDARHQALEELFFGNIGGYPRAAALLVSIVLDDGRLDEARARLQELLSRSKAAASQDLMGAGMGIAILEGELEVAADYGARAARAAVQVGDRRQALRDLAMEMILLLSGAAEHQERVDDLAAELSRLEAEAADLTGFSWLPPGYSLMGIYQYFRGDMACAWRNVIECSWRDPHAFGGSLRWYAGSILLNNGDAVAARPFLESSAPLRPEDPPSTKDHLGPVVHSSRAELYVTLGRLDDAAVWIDAAERWPLLSSAPFALTQVMYAKAKLRAAQGDLERAWQCAEEARAAAERCTSRMCQLRAHRLLGAFAANRGAWTDASAHFEASLDLAQRCRFPFEGALTHLAHGEAFAGRPGAREHLHAARDFFRDRGFCENRLVAAENALTTPRAIGEVRLSKAVTSARQVDSLTQRETEVVSLVAAGMTDRQIASQLHISPRTVDYHLRNIFSKLDVANRVSLASYAIRNGLTA